MFSSTSVATLLAFVPAFVSAAADCARSYTVKSGDFCDAISAANNVSTYQLATLNSDSINTGCTNLAIGQPLCLGTTGSDCQATYVVQSGDTCDKITSTFGINSTLVMANNPQIDAQCSNIYVGEVLCVAGQVQVPPPPASGEVTIVPPQASATPVASTTAAPAAATSAAPEDDEGDDGDCDGSDDEPVSAEPVSSAPAPASSAPAPATTAAPATTPAPATTDAPASSSAPQSDDNGDGEDDDDLPFCDEL